MTVSKHAALAAAFVLAAAAAVQAAEAGPEGGRLLESEGPRTEIVIGGDHSVKLYFYDEALKPVPAAGRKARVIAEAPSGKTLIEFEEKDGALAGKAALPEGHGYNVVVQVFPPEGGAPRNHRFKLNMEICGGCNRPEYACNCHE